MADFEFQSGPYPDDWNQEARDFWDAEPMTYRNFYDSDAEFEQAQNAFDIGWIQFGEHLTYDDHEQARQEFFELAGVDESSFDWEAFREYLHSIGS